MHYKRSWKSRGNLVPHIRKWTSMWFQSFECDSLSQLAIEAHTYTPNRPGTYIRWRCKIYFVLNKLTKRSFFLMLVTLQHNGCFSEKKYNNNDNNSNNNNIYWFVLHKYQSRKRNFQLRITSTLIAIILTLLYKHKCTKEPHCPEECSNLHSDFGSQLTSKVFETWKFHLSKLRPNESLNLIITKLSLWQPGNTCALNQ